MSTPQTTLIPETLEPLKTGRITALDRTRALYGDSPPPNRTPAPYPSGDVVYNRDRRYIVHHRDTVTNYSTFRDGLADAKDHPNEALALRFVKAHTTIPVPAVVSSDWDRIAMEYVEGQTPQQAWPVMSSEQHATVLDQLRGYIAQLRALRYIPHAADGDGNDANPPIGRLDGQGVLVPSILSRSSGTPFHTVSDLHVWLVRPPKRLEKQSMYCTGTRSLATSAPPTTRSCSRTAILPRGTLSCGTGTSRRCWTGSTLGGCPSTGSTRSR